MFEAIIVDDCSDRAETIEVEQNYSKLEKVNLINNRTNIGPGASRNLGISKAKGDIIVFVDADDYLLDNALAYVADTFESTNCDALTYEYIIEGRARRSACNSVPRRQTKRELAQVIAGTLTLNNVWRTAFQKKLIDIYNIKFNEDIINGEDYCFVADYYHISENWFYTDEILYVYCCTESGITQTFRIEKIAALLETLRVRFQIVDNEIRDDKNQTLKSIAKIYNKALFNYIALLVSNRNSDYSEYLCNDSLIRLMNISKKIGLRERLISYFIRHDYKCCIYLIRKSLDGILRIRKAVRND